MKMANNIIGVYPGTFDPITFGHIDIIKRSLKIVDELIIGIADNTNKISLFSMTERNQMIESDINEFLKDSYKIKVKPVTGLLTDFAICNKATFIIRGLRAVSDFEYEFQLAGMNKKLNSKIETMFLMSDVENQIISSKFVKEIASLGGKIDTFVTKYTARTLKNKI